MVITSQSRNQLRISGLCGSGGATISLTAARTLRATVDTAVLTGQLLCRPADTVNGFITGSLDDSTRIQFFLRVVSDTGVSMHTGTAYRQ